MTECLLYEVANLSGVFHFSVTLGRIFGKIQHFFCLLAEIIVVMTIFVSKKPYACIEFIGRMTYCYNGRDELIGSGGVATVGYREGRAESR